MDEATKEQISAFIDGELDGEYLLDKLIHDDDMKETLSRYHLIGDCLRNNLPNEISYHISKNVNRALQNESTILAPAIKRLNIKPLAGFAIAASVAMVVIFSIQNGNEIGSPTAEMPAVAKTTNTLIDTFNFTEPQVLSAAVKPSDTSESLTNQRLNDYLMHHNGYRSNGSVNGVIPYVRMVTIKRQE